MCKLSRVAPGRLSVARVLLACALLGAAGRADTLRVPQDFATLQGALSAALPGDLVLVAPGAYDESVLAEGLQQVEIRGLGAARLRGLQLTEGPAAVMTLLDCTGVTLTNLRFEGFLGLGLDAQGCQDLVVQRCRFTGGADDALRYTSGQGLLVSKCRFDGSGEDAIDLFGCSAVVVEKTSVRNPSDDAFETDDCFDVTLESCRFQDVGGDGVNSEGLGTTGFLVTRTRIRGTGDDGIDFHGTDSVFEENVLQGVGEDAIDLASTGSGNVVRLNRIRGTQEFGVRAEGTGETIDANTIVEAGSAGIRLVGSGHTVTGNKVVRPGGDGICGEIPAPPPKGEPLGALSGGHLVEGNRVVKAGADGIEFEPGVDGCTARANTVVRAGDDGIGVQSLRNLLEGNRCLQAVVHGVHMHVGGNAVSANFARGSGGSDLRDDAGAGANTYTDNDFETVDIVGGR